MLPPLAKPDTMSAISQTTLNAVCYQYRYDERNRMIAKKLPGKVWEYMVYNRLDQLVASQDSNLRGSQQWLVRKYDGQGRVILTGIFQKTGFTAAAFRDSVYKYDQWDKRNDTGTGNGYTITSYPATLNTTLTVNFYNRYDNIPNFVYTYTDSKAIPLPIGLPVLSKKLILNTTVTRLLDVYYYDEKGREHKRYSQHYLNGLMSSDNYDEIATEYNLSNQPDTVIRKHYRKTATPNAPELVLTSRDSLIYDHKGRLEQHWNRLINAKMEPQSYRLLSQHEYNEMGQLFKKKLHSTNNGSSFYQTVTYRYNARGWMVQDSAQLFKQQLYYNDGAVPQYNGNISAQSWQTNGGTLNIYNYTYDTQNRLLSGVGDNGYSEKSITYDLMGNMRTLARYISGSSGLQLIDSLRFNYTNNGQSNQMDTVRDVSGNLAYGLKTATMAYTYRGDGQVKYDGRTGNTISYALLALPQTVTGSNNITYWYDADGEKLAKESITSGVKTRTDYIEGIQYNSSNGSTPAIEFIRLPEGRARLSGSTYNYEYDLTDHLGNVRLTFTTSTGSAQMQQSTEYFPFGMTADGLGNNTSKYLYNGKELQDETNQYDYGARFYDPMIARWGTIDPLAEFTRRHSPYEYALNNPVRFVDPTGMTASDTTYIDPSRYNLKEVTVTSTPIDKSTLESVGNFIVDNLPFIGSGKQLYEGLRDGDWKKATLGAVFLTVDAFTLGEGGETFKLAEEGIELGAEELLKVGAEDEIKEGAENTIEEGIVYERTDLETGEKYVGQSKNDKTYLNRQKAHNRDFGKEHSYKELGRAEPGNKLDHLEETHIRQGGGPKNKGGSLANKRIPNIKLQEEA